MSATTSSPRPLPDPVFRLPADPGCPSVDVAAGLRYFDGQFPIYRKVAELFLEGHAGDASALVRALEAGDRDTAHRMAHTLKGLAATLGATHLRDVSAEVDHRLKAGAGADELRADFALLERGLARACEDLRAVLLSRR